MDTAVPSRPNDNSVDPFGEFALNVPDHLFYLLFQTAHHRDLRWEAILATVGLTLARWRTLAVVRRVGACSMKELARFSTVDRTTLTRSVDQLVAEELIARHIPADDRRKVLLTLSANGEALYDQAVTKLLAFNRASVQGVPVEEQRRLARFIEAILCNLIDDPDEIQSVLTFARNGPPLPRPPEERL
jgi:DNA-binding MarR family transcriptional regulator